ncbi:hypothetical protein Taro_040155, partial [Colocasia esculenta]|nr:hypothetical protein [Colocasia esculenta]
MDTGSRHWSPASPFSVPHSRALQPETLEVPVRGRIAVVLGQRLQQCSFFSQLY